MSTAFTAADDGFHFTELGPEWWATETVWFSFHEVERGLGGWFYTMVRPNIGTVAGGAWIWDASTHLPWECLYCASYTALELAHDIDLKHCRLPNGVTIEVTEPCMRYRLGYEDADRLQAELEFAGVMPPEPLTAAGSTFGSAHHFDQLGRVTGTIELHGSCIDIDCIAMRDRTWGHRPENRPRQAAYVTGAASETHGFLAVTNARDDHDEIAYGFLRRDGRTVSLAGGERQTKRDEANGWVTEVRLTGVDAEGRTLDARGRPMSRLIINRHTFIDINSLMAWDLNGETAYGEDQDMWPVHRFARRQRTDVGAHR